MLVCKTTDTHYGYNGKSDNHHRKTLALIKREMDKVGCKILLHAGDWAVCRQRQVKRTWEMFRDAMGPDVVIVGARGNHDFWSDEETYSLEQILALHRAWAEESQIHLLSEFGPKFIEDVAFIGYDGWYVMHPLTTNDPNYLPLQIGDPTIDRYLQDGPTAHEALQKRAYNQFQEMLAIDTSGYRQVVGVTHMPLYEDPTDNHNGNPRWLEFMAEKCDIICFGHSHKRMVEKVPGVECKSRIYNAGSDYGKIRHLFFEV